MSTNRVVTLIIVAVLHIVLIYALVTGLAFEAGKKLIQKVTTVDIKEPEKPKEPPPPPPKEENKIPPPVAPPVKINIAPTPPQIQTVTTPPPIPPPIIAPPQAPAAPPAPSRARGATPKGQSGWAERIQDNYPPQAQHEEKQGRVGVRVQIGPDGRVTSCSVASSSGTPVLDSAACDGMQRFARFNPALDDAGNPTSGSFSTSIVYRLEGN